jgi:hypothetical protein
MKLRIVFSADYEIDERAYDERGFDPVVHENAVLEKMKIVDFLDLNVGQMSNITARVEHCE